MSASALSLVFEGIVSILLVVMIVYASRLNGRLADLRAQEGELQAGIARFDEAAARAEAAAARLKAVGGEAERTVRTAFDRAQAMRDELMFLVERGDQASRRLPTAGASPDAKYDSESRQRVGRESRPGSNDKAAQARNRKAASAATPARAPAAPDDGEIDTAGLRSAAERELLRAIRAAHGAK